MGDCVNFGVLYVLVGKNLNNGLFPKRLQYVHGIEMLHNKNYI